MHPYDHARSSAKIHGGCWSDYFAVHAWFDATKVIQCRFTHRALRHHIEGVAEAVSNFGPSIGNRDGVKVATEQLGMQHLEEDCTHPPEATVWLIDFDAPDWLPISEPDSAELANASAATVPRALGALEDIRVHMISLSASEINLTIIVDGDRLGAAVCALHDEFFPHAPASP